MLDDLMEEVTLENSLPKGWTPESVERELGRVNAAMDDFVVMAVQLRKEHNEQIIEKYIQSHKELGVNMENKFKRNSYFRHQVIAYMDITRAAQGSQRPKQNTNRSFTKERSGESVAAINNDYLQAEYEVLAQMLYDIENNKMLKKIDDSVGIRKQVVKAAAENNKQMINGIITEELADKDAQTNAKGEPISATDQAIKSHTWKIAKGFKDLADLAKNGKLWTGAEGQWNWAADALIREQSESKEDSHGYDEDSSNNLFKYISVLVKQSGEAGQQEAAIILNGVSGKRKLVKEILGKRFRTLENSIPDGFSAWQPREGHAFYLASTIPEKMLEHLMTANLTELGMTEADIKKVWAKGSAFPSFILPSEIAETLDTMESKQPKKHHIYSLKGIAYRMESMGINRKSAHGNKIQY